MTSSNRLEMGNFTSFRLISYSQIAQQPSIQEVSKLLLSFNFKEVLINLARMNLLLSKSVQQPPTVQAENTLRRAENALRQAFCQPVYFERIASENIGTDVIFNRFAILRLLVESCRVSQPDSTRNVYLTDERYDLGKCVLMMNDFLTPSSEDVPLFSVPLDLSELLDDNNIPEDLRPRSENNTLLIPANQNPVMRFLISENDKIRAAKQGSQWQEENGDRLYSIRREEGRVDIYDAVEERKRLLVQVIPYFEYATKSPPILEKMVRSKQLLNLVLAQQSKIDIESTFAEATGLKLEEYQYLILGILAPYFGLTAEQILEGEESFVPTNHPPALENLYSRLMRHDCMSIDELPNEVYHSLSFTPVNEFRIFRAKPLVEIRKHKVICIDIDFLADKLENGIFWIVFNQLRESDRGQLFGLWGKAFEKYVGSIIERSLAVPNTDEETEGSITSAQRYIISPKYDDTGDECTDIIIYTDDTLVLLECKARPLIADAKYNGKFHDLERELKSKYIGTKKQPEGIWQLWNAINKLFHRDEKERKEIKGKFEVSKIRRIYPVLIVLENTLSTPFMNWYLDREFQRILSRPDLKVMPLSVLTIMDLEYLEPYLVNTLFHNHLDKWFELYQQSNYVFSFSSYVDSLRQEDLQINQFMDQQYNQIKSDILHFFSSHGLE